MRFINLHLISALWNSLDRFLRKESEVARKKGKNRSKNNYSNFPPLIMEIKFNFNFKFNFSFFLASKDKISFYTNEWRNNLTPTMKTCTSIYVILIELLFLLKMFVVACSLMNFFLNHASGRNRDS